jgi:hypothetical protein
MGGHEQQVACLRHIPARKELRSDKSRSSLKWNITLRCEHIKICSAGSTEFGKRMRHEPKGSIARAGCPI